MSQLKKQFIGLFHLVLYLFFLFIVMFAFNYNQYEFCFLAIGVYLMYSNYCKVVEKYE